MSSIVNPSLSLTTRNKERLVMGTFNGSFTISVFAGQAGGKPVFGNNMSVPDMLKVRKLLMGLAQMPPSNQKALTVSARGDDGFSVVGTICIGKDDEGVSYIEVQFKANGAPRTLRFNTDFFCTLAYSERERNKQLDAAEGVEAILWWMEHVLPIALVHSKLPPKSRPQGGGGEPF
jgi:hypothetical protein